LWGLIEGKLGPAPEADRDLWSHLATLVDRAEFRPKRSDDIEVKRFALRSGEPYYMIANPRDLVHFRLNQSDYELVSLMDGTRTVKEIVLDRFRESGDMELDGVADLVHQLHADNFFDQRYTDVAAMLKHAIDPSEKRRLRPFATSLGVASTSPGRLVHSLPGHALRS